jgi:hypothetical protein
MRWGNAVRYECDFLIHSNDGEIAVTGARAFNAFNLPQAIKWVDEKVQSAPEVFHNAYAVRLRHDGKVVWLKALGVLHAPAGPKGQKRPADEISN